jgi:hypothetical protein
MKAQIRAKTRIRGRDWAIYAVWMKKTGAGGLVGLVSGDALTTALSIRVLTFDDGELLRRSSGPP